MVMEREEALEAATRLVDEVIQEAEAEAARRRKESAAQSSGKKSLNEDDLSEGGISAIIKRGTRLQTRARGFVTRILTQLRICK
uniref:Unkown protein n=1 Tax=Riptortus pedestris TaxID=329032 RepID=R4WDZ2_RIPPE|nr:unkown protein [Riptortus pedestris]